MFAGVVGRKDTAAVNWLTRSDLGPGAMSPAGPLPRGSHRSAQHEGTLMRGVGDCVLSLAVMSDVQVMDSVSPARCEWVELLAHEPRWQPLLHMHRPYEALTHWALAAHVEALHRHRLAPCSQRPYDLMLSLGDNIDNAQLNELEAFLAIVAGGTAQLSALGGVHEPDSDLRPWPYWCPDAAPDDLLKRQGYPIVADFLQRASAPLTSRGLGFAWTSVPGNHDLMRQGTALPQADIERIAVGRTKTLHRPAGFDPADPLTRFIEAPDAFSLGGTRRVPALASRRAVSKQEWIAAHVAAGAAGYSPEHARRGCADLVIDTEQVRIILLDTNHPAGDYQGSVGAAQLDWLEAQLGEVGRQKDRLAVLASHHGSVSLTNTLGADPQRLHASALTGVMHHHPCLVAWLVGHRHLHEIKAHPGPGGGFWEISTGSLIDWPVQTRAVELLRHGGGAVEIVCSLQDHHAPANSLAQLHHALARRFAGDQAAAMQGLPHDGNVRLWRP